MYSKSMALCKRVEVVISKLALLCIWPSDWLNSGKVNRADITHVG